MEGNHKLADSLKWLCNRLLERDSPFWSKLAARWDPILLWIADSWSRIWNPLVRAPWLCGYDSLAAVLVVFFFAFNDQGQDLLRISADRGFSPWNFLFFIGTAVLSLTLWYTARLLLGRKFESQALDLRHARGLQRWLPRLYGTVAPLSIAYGFMQVQGESNRVAVWVLCSLYVLLALGLLWFFVARRRLFDIPADKLIEDQTRELVGCDLLLMWGAGILSFLLLVAFMVWPVGLPRFMGAPSIVVLGLAGIALFGSMVLTYAFLAYGQPAGTALVLALAVLFAFWNDNHRVRTVDEAELVQVEAAAAARPHPREHYRAWRAANTDFEPVDGREPVILVAAAGGGIRAAYWTASALATMDRIQGFGGSLFAVSGVSGGSVGAATYAAAKREKLEAGELGDLVPRVREVLREDFLSPVVAGLLFPDLAQRFLPFPIASADRQRFLEESWEASFGGASNAFTDGFATLFQQGYDLRLPSLLLNATVVDSGRRAIVSNLRVDAFTDAVDLLAEGFSTRYAKLSSAAGMSARFTYVSPPGSLLRPYDGEGGTEEVKMRVVDGGYFENSGAATLLDLLDLLGRDNRGLFPILILIRNDPKAPFVCHRPNAPPAVVLDEGPEGPPAGDFLSEIAAPVRALLNARSARGRLAEVDAAREVEGRKARQSPEVEAARKVGELGGAVIEISLAAVVQSRLEAARALGQEAEEQEEQVLRRRVVEPPLGWSLSRDARADMDRVLDEGLGGLKRELGILEELLRGRFDPVENRCDAS